MYKKVLVTGVGGFVGRNLSTFLSKEGSEVFGLARGTSKHPDESYIKVIRGDILDCDTLHTVIETIKPDVIFHLAALSRVGQSYHFPEKTLKTNIFGTLSLLEAMRTHTPRCRIVFASSAEVYGSPEVRDASGIMNGHFHPFNEENIINPTTSPYSISKICGEYLMHCYAHAFGVDSVIVRSFNIEGPERGDDFATGIICKQVASLEDDFSPGITIGNLAIFRDFTHITDAVRAYDIVSRKGSSGKIYNIGSMKLSSLASFLLYALQARGITTRSIHFENDVCIPDPLVEVVPWNGSLGAMTVLDATLLRHPEYIHPDSDISLETNKGRIKVRIDKSRFRPAENPVMIADTRLITELGYTPEYSLEQLVHDQVQYYLKKGCQ